MSRAVLIHGYGANIDSPFHKINPELDFQAFERHIKEDKAKIYIWCENTIRLGLLESFNPFIYQKIYRQDKTKATSDENFQKLHDFLIQEQPEILVCHSLGCHMILSYLEHYQLPGSVKKVFLIQADIPHNRKIPQIHATIYNVFCYWDVTLVLSMVVNLYIPAGLIGLKNCQNNIFFPLYKRPNLHLSSIGDKNLLKTLELN